MPAAFDIAAPLPVGTTVLEASAGTGKTYTVGALVTRYLAEGVATLDQLLVVTFGRAASQELRDRIRQQLVAVHRALGDQQQAGHHPEPLVRVLAAGTAQQVLARRERLARALADFDAATIATTHQFCQQVLASLGVAGDSDPGAVLVEDLDDLVVEVVDDLYVRGFAPTTAGRPEFDRDTALRLGRAAMLHPDARLEPADAAPESVPARRFRFAYAVRREVEVRKRRRGLLSYDDLLSKLADALEPEGAARERMRARWKVVLIDEFQDTDPVQWQVLQRAFADHCTLILIGDPKQAIYAFRGGDVVTYLRAAKVAGTHATLEQNWRADAGLVDALQVLLDGAELGDPQIAVLPVLANHAGSRLHDAPSPAPLRLRVVRREQLRVGPRSLLKVGDLRPFIAKDLAADIAGLLTSGATFDSRPLRAGDIAVLVNTHAQGELIRSELAAAGVPSVTAAAGSVFTTAAGEDWLILLEALEQPHRTARVRAAALTPFLGYTTADIDSGGDELTEELGGRLRDWAELLHRRGVAALAEAASAELDLLGRLLRRPDGERRVTDLRHVGQALQRAATESGLGLAALTEWLRRRRSEVGSELSADRVRRLDSDAAAVQVLTLHVSKGLQFPVVYLPFAADRREPEEAILQLHDQDGQRLLDVGGDGSPGRGERVTVSTRESAGEALRLLYVGLTRAQSQVVAWWAPAFNAKTSGLHRILFGRQGDGRIAEVAQVPGDDEAADHLTALQRRGGPVVESAGALLAMSPPAQLPVVGELSVAAFDRTLDHGWRRASYSALAAAADEVLGRSEPTPAAGVGSEPESGERDDESDYLGTDPTGAAAMSALDPVLSAIASPMAGLPSGAAFGTLVHGVLETTDPGAADLSAELRARCAEQLARHPMPVTPDELAAALEQTLTSPLGPLADGLALRDISVADRLAELDFELPLAGGDEPAAELTLAALAPLLRRHLPAQDPLRGYADRLAAPGLAEQPLRGFLTGSLDVVLRLPGPRYLIADYKTNLLADVDGLPLSAWHYRPDALREAMNHSHYPLQALLYAVALHRFLRWRQPGYDPDAHLGGVLYLYVRGMCGPDTPLVDGQPCGVFGWRPPGVLVAELSDLLDAGPTR